MSADPLTHLATPNDLEIRAARIADPSIDLRTKHVVASEIREMLETVRDTESVRALPYLVSPILELIRAGEPAMIKDAPEFQFRRLLLDILNRLPVHDVLRPQVPSLLKCMLHVIKTDNEDDGVLASKTMVDVTRGYRIIPDEIVTDTLTVMLAIFDNMRDLVLQTLSDESPALDSALALPAMRSFKVIGEMSMVMVIMAQVHRPVITSTIQQTIPPAFELLGLESPAQHTARTNYEAMGGIWAGMAPTIKNALVYSDFTHSQIKMLSYLAYVMRYAGDHDETYGETLILRALRLLQDCPASGIPLRKELMVVFRHLMTTNHRKALYNHLDKLFDENVLLGTGIGTKEMLRPAVYTAVADLVHHIKNDLTSAQLTRVMHVYSRLMHNPSLGNNLHTMFAKVMLGLTDTIIAKESPQDAARSLNFMLESCIERLEAIGAVYDEVVSHAERVKGDGAPDATFIEKARPIANATYGTEKADDVILESRIIFRTLLHGFRVCLGALKKCDGPTPDGTLMFRLFEGCIRCMSLLDPDPRSSEQNDAIDWFAHAIIEMNLHVFQEVWTHKFAFFFEHATKRVLLLNVCQFLFTRESTSPTLLGITLRFLVDRLPMLGELDDLSAIATIRLFKMAFGAVGTHPALNEPILATHLAKLLMDCFPLAAKATRPMHYFHLLRALFRAIGGGGGRFELLYKEVLPLLPDMLESLNRQLLASDGPTRDMIVELCLTVPLRLTHLLPHLSYLMQPLALALKGNPELVSQGLRTLELCIDNLTPDFLDPTLSTVLRELMEALHNLLKPIPANHHHAHTTIRILGKLGGRNRRLLAKEPALNYHHHSESAKMAISFGGSVQKIGLASLSDFSAKSIFKLSGSDRVHAYNYMENCICVILHEEGLKGPNMEDTFVKTVEGVFDAFLLSETQTQAESFIRKLSHTVFDAEIRRAQMRDSGLRPAPGPLVSCYLDAFPHALARELPEHAKKSQELVMTIIQDLVGLTSQPNISPQDILPILHQFASRFTALCLDDSWVRKSAGCNAVKLMINTPELGARWVTEREGDLIRTLLHILKDLPHDPPRDVDDVIEVLINVLRISNTGYDFQSDNPTTRNKLVYLVGMFFPELQSSNSVTRRAAQMCLATLVDLSGKSAVELLIPHRERVLVGIYTKPLRALPFPKQIGIIEAIRYCISLEPPLVEFNEELLRLLTETLGLADADDAALLGRGSLRQASLEVTRLRVACIKLLTASMTLTGFFVRQPAIRQRVTGLYFKSLYSPSAEVKDVAHDGLRMVLTHQSKLPKDLLQTGLRPILMNLADPKRLSVPGLEGLARLLELLTNYFKVEIGHKLLDHFRIVADAQVLQSAARMALDDNEAITKLVRLANIFHLLPAAANIFLENFVNAVVQTEAQMHFSTQSPFSEPLAKYLDRYPTDGVNFFLTHFQFPRHLRTLRSIIQAKLAPNLHRELASRTAYIVDCLKSDQPVVLPALQVLEDLAELTPNWFAENTFAIDAIVNLWQSEFPSRDPGNAISPEAFQRHTLMLSIFMKALNDSPRIDLLFEVISFYSRNLGMDIIRVTQFLYKHVALRGDIIFRRNVLMRFLTWFDNPSVSWSDKAYFIRYIVTPTLLVQATPTQPKEQLLDSDFIACLHRSVWHPIVESGGFSETDDMFKIEILHLTTVLVQHYPELLEEPKKDIIKCAWHYVSNSDDVLVKQTAYLLAARFSARFNSPGKFIIRAWTGLLRAPHSEGRPSIRQEALATLAPSLSSPEFADSGPLPWARSTRKLLAEEGLAQIITVYQVILKQGQLFFSVRSLFVPHIAISLSKLGISATSTAETRALSLDLLQLIFDWETQANQLAQAKENVWLTPLVFRESMVSYLVRLATIPQESSPRNTLGPRALNLLQQMIGPSGWTDVTVGLRFFSRALEQGELTAEPALAQALTSAKVLQVVAAQKSDAWYTTNALVLQSLVRKGMAADDHSLQDALHHIFDKLVQLHPLPKEDEEPSSELHEFHAFIYSAINDGLRDSTVHRGIMLMLQTVIQVTPERIEVFAPSLSKLSNKLMKDHITAGPPPPNLDPTVQIILMLLKICQTAVAFLGEQRRWLFTMLVHLAEKSKSPAVCRYVLDLARTWAFGKQDPYPTMKEKATLLQKMATLETRGDGIFQSYLELIYDIYTEPSLRRSDLTNRLEQPFLIGCRSKDPVLREKFMDLLDMSVPRSLLNRMTYIFGVQGWEALSDCNWIGIALHLIFGAADADVPTSHERRFVQPGPLRLLSRPRTQTTLKPIQRLLPLDTTVAHDIWVSVFPAAWGCLSRREQADITHHMINLLSKDYHTKQAHLRPNIVQTLLEGIQACSPPVILPPHLVKYLAKTFGAWHVGLEILGPSLEYVKDDEPVIRDYVYDSMADLYAELAEDDLFYGLWRRRALHPETNIALAYEQNGMWEQASIAYENAQSKARAGTIPFVETEYCLWEDHWILSAEKLQQWDVLYELASNEGNHELMLESAWRIKEWADNKESLEEQINQLPEFATPRRRVFEAFIALLKNPGALDKNVEFTRFLEDAMQLSLRKWVSLPPHLSAAHIPLLQHFQQFVELQEAVQIFGSLSQTNAQNLEKKSSELKMVLQAWRERLPNLQDDISIWSDLVAWRQNVFHSINNAYIPLIGGPNQSSNTPTSTNTYGYRGYHETAWIINRFAHVARKHDLLDVCFTSLTKIYTLPNIEISEAFLKLREQARCHYQKPNDLQAGLEVINNTNLMFFSGSQKAEFYTLKGMFHARFGRNEEANLAFGQAVQLDMNQAKAWAEWGRYNDRMFKENPTDLSHAANAVSCYLQAAGQYKNVKSRPLLARVLWLLSVDDSALLISKAFDTYKGDAAFWYWLSFIPQLCSSLSQRESRQARYVLLNLCRHYPQAVFYHLRTTREDLQFLKKAQAMRTANMAQVDPARRPQDQVQPSEASKEAITSPNQQTEGQPGQGERPPVSAAAPPISHPIPDASLLFPRQAWDIVDDILQNLKSAFPLLILSLETMVDQIQTKFKLSPEEDIYRIMVLLLQDAVQGYVVRMNSPEDDGLLTQHTVQSVQRMSQNVPAAVKKEYEDDLMNSKLTHYEYIQRLQSWRDKYEALLDSRPRFQHLSLLSNYLTEFQYSKVDEIEVPGQYTEDKDSNQNFIRIQKFAPKFEHYRSAGNCWKRIVLHGNDNSKSSFVVQLPCHRHHRREDRVMQVLRTFNLTLNKKKESRKRNLGFHLPVAVSCSPHVRLFQTDSSYIAFSDIYDQFCEENNISREEPTLFAGEKVKKVLRDFRQSATRQLAKAEYFSLKKDIYDEIAVKMIPDNVLTQFMSRTMKSPSELWRMRKQFALQIASSSFMTYFFGLTSRVPARFLLSRSTGLLALIELLPSTATHMPVFATNDLVPFRMTANMQNFLGPVATEGIVTSGIFALGRGLTEPEYDLEQQLCLFTRDEVGMWWTMRGKPFVVDLKFRQSVATNLDVLVKRAESMACKLEREQALQNPGTPPQVPVVQTVTNLISSATNPLQIAKMGELYHPWF